ncbi:MAG: PEP-CTERM sorting domain-containing protein [Acidobacteriota bacterium]
MIRLCLAAILMAAVAQASKIYLIWGDETNTAFPVAINAQGIIVGGCGPADYSVCVWDTNEAPTPYYTYTLGTFVPVLNGQILGSLPCQAAASFAIDIDDNNVILADPGLQDCPPEFTHPLYVGSLYGNDPEMWTEFTGTWTHTPQMANRYWAIDSTGGLIRASAIFSLVPEPSTFILIGAGLVAILSAARKTRRPST